MVGNINLPLHRLPPSICVCLTNCDLLSPRQGVSFILACTSTLTSYILPPSLLSHSLTLPLSHPFTLSPCIYSPTLPSLTHPLTPSPPHPLTLQPVSMVEDNGLVIVRCKRHLVTRLLIGDVLLLVAYLWGLYIFRFKSPEHLATLMETVIFVVDKKISAESYVVVDISICKNH